MALVSMIPELLVYGLVCGLMMKIVRTGKLIADLYLALIPAMILGRVVGGIAKALFITLMATGEAYGIGIWAASYFVGSFPGIVCHLILIPTLIAILMRAKVIPSRYGQTV